jgi:hypothetical protein
MDRKCSAPADVIHEIKIVYINARKTEYQISWLKILGGRKIPIFWKYFMNNLSTKSKERPGTSVNEMGDLFLQVVMLNFNTFLSRILRDFEVKF